MKINPFISVYNARVKHINDLSQDKIIEVIADLIKPVNHLPFDDKLKIVDFVIEQTKDLKYPTAERYRLLITNLISAYTSLECDLNGYDTLVSSKLLDPIIHTFESEYIFCHQLMQMCISDIKGGDNYVGKSG